ncbi:UDP-glucosyltransferase 2-like isoform X1 [Galleria mellonella]|uniref:UDP-glucuronosyltransferase n=2 Tax=Galleria mellonella TaxID=7137 RepID=A0ABM3MMX4_GALME|nr:UDP-glucosyltransferase 2-like isoform X1 [Galleria mellonella]
MLNIYSLYIYLIFCVVVKNDAARILGYFPTPSISHQVVFQTLMLELAKRGHDVTVITTDPISPKTKFHSNLTEVDLHDLSYSIWREAVYSDETTTGKKSDIINQVRVLYNLVTDISEQQINSKQVQRIIQSKKEKFDLIFIESLWRPGLGLAYIFNAPIILISSLLPIYNNMEAMGSPVHPILYPMSFRQKLNNLTIWDKIIELYNHYSFIYMFDTAEKKQNEMMKRVFGSDIPPLSELYNNIDMLFLNAHPFWDSNRPVPPNVVYLGGLHRKPVKELPQELQFYLDSSKHGVIYMSYGTNVSPSQLPPEKIQMIVNVFSRLPYDVIWKWDKDELPGRSKNIKISKWLPQSDLLRHPKVLLFITQGGLQSTDEAITAGVPLIGMPMLGDQWYNVEQYVRHGIGVRLDLEDLTEEKFYNAINTTINDKSYRQNVERLRTVMSDQPQSALERAVWWTEYVLRHKGAKHLRSPAANISWGEFLEIELVTYLLLGLTSVIFAIVIFMYYVVLFIKRYYNANKKQKSN